MLSVQMTGDELQSAAGEVFAVVSDRARPPAERRAILTSMFGDVDQVWALRLRLFGGTVG